MKQRCFLSQWLYRLYTEYITSPLHKKRSFPIRISSVNMNKSAVSYGFGHINWRNSGWKTSFLCSAHYFLHYFALFDHIFRTYQKRIWYCFNINKRQARNCNQLVDLTSELFLHISVAPFTQWFCYCWNDHFHSSWLYLHINR